MSAFDYDVAVIGSGFGGSTTALRLTEKGYKVVVIEAGRRWKQSDFPKSNWNLRKFLFVPKLGLRGIQRLTFLKDVLVLSGAGVGGGSLVYANTLYEPLEQFFDDPQWRDITDWREELSPYYEQAKRMLGATTAHDDTPADQVMRDVADQLGVSETYHPTQVGVYYGEKGREVEDPFFGGEGPTRTGCLECGACMIGCRHNAKNTLDHNYLYLAEAKGAQVMAYRQVTDVIPLPGHGYEIVSERSGAWYRKNPKSVRAEQVVFSAGVLGTMRLLGSLRENGRLGNLSPALGELVRTNSEAILGAEAMPDAEPDYSHGVAITSSIYPDDMTHVEPVRYPKKSSFMGLLSVPIVDGGKGPPRWAKFILQTLRHPRVFLMSLSLRRWAERTVILLVMQSRDNSLTMRWRRRRKGKIHMTTEQGHGEPNPTYIPEANTAARLAADAMGGYAGSSVNEVMAEVPTTAHILGGAAIGADANSGVIDAYQRVYGHPGLHVADGSAISANLGVNPSLTITAQTERAMSMWPNNGDDDPRPELGKPYEKVKPVHPKTPAVPATAPAAIGW